MDKEVKRTEDGVKTFNSHVAGGSKNIELTLKVGSICLGLFSLGGQRFILGL